MLSVNASYYDCHSLLFSLLLVKGVRKAFLGEMSTVWGFLGLVGINIVRKKGMRLLDGGPAGSHAWWKHGMEEEPRASWHGNTEKMENEAGEVLWRNEDIS